MDKITIGKGMAIGSLTVIVFLSFFITFLGTVAGYFNNLQTNYDEAFFTVIKIFAIVSILLTISIILLNGLVLFAEMSDKKRKILRWVTVGCVIGLLMLLIIARFCVPTGSDGYWVTLDSILYITFRNAFMIPTLVYTSMITFIAQVNIKWKKNV